MKLRSKIQVLLLGCAMVWAQGCATASKGRTSPTSPSPMGPVEPFGPPAPEPAPSYGPDPVQLRPIVLVLGPGLARGFAFVGVLEGLTEAKIPIGAILSTEMGSLIGTLYAMSSTPNQFEWGLLRFKEDVFREPRGFLSKTKEGPSNGERYEKALQVVFGEKDLTQAKIPIRIAIQSRDTGIPIVLDRGNAARAIRAATAMTGVFTAGNWQDGNSTIQAVAASSTRPFLVTEARNLGLGSVVVVNVLGDAESAFALEELKGADLVIKPDVSGLGYLDFKKKTEAAFRGKNAVLQHLSELRHLVGLAENDSDRRSGP